MAADDNEAIIDAIAYNWQAANQMFISPPIRTRINKRGFSSKETPSGPNHLEKLSIELLLEIFNYLSWPEIANLLFVGNRGIKDALKKFLPLQDVLEHASTLILILYKTELFNTFSATQIHYTLKKDRCVQCNAFAPYVFLPTSSRCCLQCLHNHEDLHVIAASSNALRDRYGLSKAQIGQLPTESCSERSSNQEQLRY